MPANFRAPFGDYETADRWLGNRSERRVSANCRLERSDYPRLQKKMICLILHATCIVEYHEDGSIVVNTGGYHTPTTKRYINGASPASITTRNHQLMCNGEPWDGTYKKVR